MARYKHIDTSPRFMAVDLERQLLPGTFEYALNYMSALSRTGPPWTTPPKSSMVKASLSVTSGTVMVAGRMDGGLAGLEDGLVDSLGVVVGSVKAS